MRIAFVNQPFERLVIPVESGSIRIWTHAVASALVPEHEVLCFVRRHGGTPADEVAGGIHYRRIWAVSEPALFHRLPLRVTEEWPPTARAWAFWSYFVQVAADLRRMRPDCALVHNYSQAIPIIRAFNPRMKIGLLMHCEWLRHWDESRLRPRLAQADLLLGVSDWVTGGIRSRFPEFQHRTETLHNGVDLDRFQPGPSGAGGKRFLYAGRVSPEKGLHVLLRAFEHVLAQHPASELEVVGGAPTMHAEFLGRPEVDPELTSILPLCGSTYLHDLRSDLPPAVSARVRFRGQVPHSLLCQHFHKTDLTVVPSVVHEGFGLPALESMAAGIPVIASNSGGLPEVVLDGQTGTIVPRNDAKALADAMIFLLENPERRESMRRASRARACGFSWGHTAQRLVELMGGNR